MTPIPGQAGANIESYPAQGPDTGSNHTGNTAPAPQLPTILVTPNDGVAGGTVVMNISGQDQEVHLPSLVEPDRAEHILNGDGPGSGGHLWPGQPGKTPFPQSWDADKILGNISDVATDPASIRVAQPNGRIRVTGVREGVEILVIVEPLSKSGKIVTGYPTNLPRNE